MLSKNSKSQIMASSVFVFYFSGHHSHVQDAATEVDLRADEEPRGVGDADVHNDIAAEDCLNLVGRNNNKVQL